MRPGEKYQYITDPPPKNKTDGVVILISYIGHDLWRVKEDKVSFIELGLALHTRYKKIN